MYCELMGCACMGQMFTFARVVVEYRASENVTPGLLCVITSQLGLIDGLIP